MHSCSSNAMSLSGRSSVSDHASFPFTSPNLGIIKVCTRYIWALRGIHLSQCHEVIWMQKRKFIMLIGMYMFVRLSINSTGAELGYFDAMALLINTDGNKEYMNF